MCRLLKKIMTVFKRALTSAILVFFCLLTPVLFLNCAPIGKPHRPDTKASLGSTTSTTLRPQPTPSPTPQSTPSPQPSPSPITSPLPSPRPSPSPQISPTPRPSPSPTPRPSPSPSPIPTPSPTPQPSPSPSPFHVVPWPAFNKFYSGVSHIKGRYSFQTQNFLIEGADRLINFGIKGVFFYLVPDYSKGYPANGGVAWPSPAVSNLRALSRTAPYTNTLSKNFELILLTTYEFSVPLFSNQSGWENSVENEIYLLTKALINDYTNSHKTFVIKNWEGDWHTISPDQTNQHAPLDKLEWMKKWFQARQRGITRARNELGEKNVRVFHALEVNRVLDADRGLDRLINKVAPHVASDLIAYSSYDALYDSTSNTESKLRQNINKALGIINNYAQDPLNLGTKRIVITEYGLAENQSHALTPSVMANTMLSASKNYGIFGSFIWQLFDNECTTPSGAQMGDNLVALPPGHPDRPRNQDCRGFWLVLPDGNINSNMVNIIKNY